MCTPATSVRYRVTTSDPKTVTWSYEERPTLEEIDEACALEFEGIPRGRIVPKARPDDDVFALEEMR
jgi:hypothetical protein